LERSELPFSVVLGEVKYKISVPDGNRDESDLLFYAFVSGIADFKKFYYKIL